jgi:uncharacterized damage-inducible protein DinB
MFAAICALALAACAPADTGGSETAGEMAADEMAADDAAATATSTVQSELLGDLANLREKYVGLAEAMPESAYGWRPGDGVRSVSEVYMHVAAANIGLVGRVMGTDPPMGVEAWYGDDPESVTDKATVVAALAASFDYMAEAIQGTGGDAWGRDIELFGPTSVRGAMTFTLAHCHEHLGQSIAYARVNGVVPPWSAGG